MSELPLIGPERLVSLTSAGLAKSGESIRGPTPTSCWLIPGFVLWSDTPNGTKLAAILACGATQFLSACGGTTESDIISSNGNVTVDHVDVSQPMAASGSVRGIAQAAFVIKRALSQAINTPNGVLCVFCEDGSTFSAMVACAVLSYVYGITGLKAMTVVWHLHSSGRVDGHQQGPQHFTAAQKAFIRDLSADTQPWSSVIRGDSISPLKLELLPNVAESSHEASSTPQRSSRFGSTRGTGGGLQSINLFATSCDSASSCERTRCSISLTEAALQPSPLRSGLLSSPQVRTVTDSSRSTPARPSSASVLSNHSTSVSSQHDRREDRSPVQQSPSLANQSEFEGSFVILLNRASLAHAWGIVLEGRTVRHVLPMSPAEQAGFEVGYVVEAVNKGIYNAESSFEWMTRQAISLSISVSRPGLEAAATFPIPPPLTFPPSLGRTDGTVESALMLHPNAAPPMLDPRTEQELIRGPTAQSNWIVRDRILCGPQPDPNRIAPFHALMRANIDVFVSLVETDHAHQSYIPLMSSSQDHPTSVWFPMRDGVPISSNLFPSVLKLVRDIIRWAVEEHKRVYVHCHNGHGRTGMIASCILGLLYQLPAMRAVNYCGALHSCRTDTEDQSSPQTAEQRLCVMAILTNAATE